MTSTRRNLWIPDELWRRAQQAALKEALRIGRPVSVSEWVRRAMKKRLEGGGE